jgi:hypothetical protein
VHLAERECYVTWRLCPFCVCLCVSYVCTYLFVCGRVCDCVLCVIVRGCSRGVAYTPTVVERRREEKEEPSRLHHHQFHFCFFPFLDSNAAAAHPDVRGRWAIDRWTPMCTHPPPVIYLYIPKHKRDPAPQAPKPSQTQTQNHSALTQADAPIASSTRAYHAATASFPAMISFQASSPSIARRQA